MNLVFLGAAKTVTGSKYLVESGRKRILIDCGLFQGLKSLRLLNWERPAVSPDSIDAILITHGHLDHIGYLPRFVKLGFKGRIYATQPTVAIAEITLKDTAKIQEEEAERANKEGYSKHHPAEPLYDLEDVKKTMKLFKVVEEGVPLEIDRDFTARFLYNGHILGSTFIELEANGKRLVFSGDIGREEDFLLYPPKKPKNADVLLMETTYGGREHLDEASVIPELQEIITKTINRQGSVFLASFAVERAQLLMYLLWQLAKNKKIPKVPMILDTPMGADILRLFKASPQWHKLDEKTCQELCSYFNVVKEYKDHVALARSSEEKIVIAGSGMLTGGRILNYLEERGGSDKDTLILTGFQAEGTRGRDLLHGAKELKIYGRYVPFRMELHQLEGLSAHADQEGLLNWLSDLEKAPEALYLIHGEPSQMEVFKQKLKETKGWEAIIPSMDESVNI
jgi:metallo-beta-lactamase family protein